MNKKMDKSVSNAVVNIISTLEDVGGYRFAELPQDQLRELAEACRKVATSLAQEWYNRGCGDMKRICDARDKRPS